ncbi:LamG domain-containing protein, partial [Candidatus Bathyarchaeota archaeon]|nr:LamG domain-containing protein [Candidatus Bathyarchaeota archaeon]
YIEPAGGNIGFEIGKEGSTVTWAGALAPVNSYLAVGKWSHIVGTADTATHKVCLYIDGVKVDERSFSGQINTNSIAFQIGKRSDGGYFGGIIDEVRIYDRALSASEISSYYDANKPVHWLTVTAICDPYGATLYPWVKIDGHYTDYINSLTRGSYTVEVEDPWWFPYGEFEFDRFTYDGTTVTSNPMPMYVSKDTEVIAHYTLSGW